MENLRTFLDLGNGYIKWAVFSKEEGKNVVLAKEIVKTKWMRKWRILDVDDFVYSIHTILDSFAKKLWNDFLDEVYIGVSHPDFLIKRFSEQKRILEWEVTQNDMDHISNLIYEVWAESNYETIKIIPVKWIVNDNMVLRDPLGMEWNKLELVADVFMLPKNFYNTLEDVFDKLDVDIADIVPNILWSSEVALDFEVKDLGCVLLDIGNNQTSYVVYEEGYPLKYWVLPIGWEEVTKDVSIWLQIDVKEAENLKREKWFIPEKWEKYQDESVDVWFLADIIVARYEEIFSLVNQDLQEMEKDWRLPWGVILVWGGSKIKNLDALAKEVFKIATFYGEDSVMKIGNLSSNLQFVNLIWDNLWSLKYSWIKSSWWFGFGIWTNLFKRIVKFFKDIF